MSPGSQSRGQSSFVIARGHAYDTEVNIYLSPPPEFSCSRLSVHVLFFNWVSRSIEKQHFFSTVPWLRSRQLVTCCVFSVHAQNSHKQEADRIGSAYVVLASSPDRTRVRIWSCWVCFQKCTQKVLTNL